MFLGAAGIGAATLALPACAGVGDDAEGVNSDLSSKKPPRIAIVGAGISGLSAALKLADAGLGSGVTVYESSNRIGGRMFSNSAAVAGAAYWDDNQVSEWCGELVDTPHVTILGLCKRFGIPVDDLPASAPKGSTTVSFFDGEYYTEEEVRKDFAAVFKKIQSDAESAVPKKKNDGSPNKDETAVFDAITEAGKALDKMSVFEWIEKNVPGGHKSKFGKLLDAAYGSELGADTSEQSALNLVLLLATITDGKFAPFGDSDERFHIRGGNQLLPLAIADDLKKRLGPDVIQMNTALTKITKNQDGTITLALNVKSGGKTQPIEVTADTVILTLPFAVLADAVDFVAAGFDERKTRAIRELGRGRCSKLQVQFKSRLWNTAGPWGVNNGEETFSDNGNQCSWHVTRGQPGASGIINGYSGGSLTDKRAAIAQTAFGKANVGSMGAAIASMATELVGQLDQIFPGVKALYTGKATLSIPHLDENFRVSYAFWKVGQYQAFAGYERVPQGSIFFGGEHCSVNFQGFMEGGAAEGVRAATEVLAAVQTGKVAAKVALAEPTSYRRVG
jgi:monoamine oxidase